MRTAGSLTELHLQVGLATALRYAMTRRAFSPAPGKQEVLLLDYPTHQRRLLPLLAKTYVFGRLLASFQWPLFLIQLACFCRYAAAFAANHLKNVYLTRQNADTKFIHVLSSGLKAMNSWHMLRTLQVWCIGVPFKKTFIRQHVLGLT